MVPFQGIAEGSIPSWRSTFTTQNKNFLPVPQFYYFLHIKYNCIAVLRMKISYRLPLPRYGSWPLEEICVLSCAPGYCFSKHRFRNHSSHCCGGFGRMTSCQCQQHAWVDTPEGTCLEQEQYPPPFQTLTRTTCPVGGPSTARPRYGGQSVWENFCPP